MSWRHRAFLVDRPAIHGRLVRTGQSLPPVGRRDPTRCDLVGSTSGNWLYVGIPLTGSRTVISTLAPGGSGDLWRRRRATPKDVQALGVESGRFVFAFVGNPWRRVVSCFNKKVVNCNTAAKIALLSRHRGLSPAMSFDEFVRWLASDDGADPVADPHWCSQSRFLHSASGRPLTDRVGRSERLEDDLGQILRAQGLDAQPLATRRRSTDMPIPPAHLDYRDYYTDELHGLVAERYASDIALFGYEF